jgi:hypothetical protein
LSGLPETQAKIIAALESVGVEFIAENGGGPGVRLKKPRNAASKVKKGD